MSVVCQKQTVILAAGGGLWQVTRLTNRHMPCS